MAATNFTPIILYHTTTASAAPTAGNLNNGELAINITDGKLFYKDNGGTVQVIATKGTGTIGGSNTQVQYNSSGALAGSANFTFNGTTATINTLNLTNALGTTHGGTGLNAYTTGDLVYASGTNTLAKLGIGLNTYILTSTGSVPQWSAPSAVTVSTANNLAGGAAGSVPYQSGAGVTTFLSIGTANQVLTSSGTAPQWSNLSSLGVSSLSFGTTGLTPSTATQGAITVGGTLATTNGGTGLSSFVANRVFYSSSTSAIGQSANLTFDGNLLTVANFTDSSLTAGRVTYAGAGGNLIDNSALTFDASTLLLNAANVSYRGQISIQGGASDFSQVTFYRGATTDTNQVGYVHSNNAPNSSQSMVIGARNGAYLRFDVGDAQRAAIDTTGRFLLGITSGNYALDVGDVSGGNMFRFTRSGVELSAFISGGTPFLGTTSNTVLAFMTNSTERGRFDTSGNLLVNTINNYAVGATGYVMAKSGYVFAADNTGSANNRNWLISPNGSAEGSLDFVDSSANNSWPNNAYRMSLTSAGQLLVGATSLASGFSTIAQIQASGSNGGIIINSSSTGASDYSRLIFTKGNAFGNEGLIRYSTNDYHMAFWTNATEKMRITAGGVVSINSASPDTNFRLYVDGFAFAKCGFSSYTGDGLFNANSRPSVINTPANSTLRFGYVDDGGGQYNPAIGFRPGPILGTGQTDYSNAIYATTNGALAFSTSTAGSYAERMRITNGGEVGVGVTPTLYKGQLQVGGTGNDLIVGNQARIGGNSGNGFFVVNGYYDQATTTGKFLNNGYQGQLDFAVGTGIWTLGATAASGTAGNNLATAVSLITASEGDTLALQGATQSTGTGIAFPATQSASSNANTLDDYEEGTWTPAVRGSGTAGTYQLSTAEGAYVKIGQQVTLTCRVIFGTITGGGTGYLQITGAPSFNNAYVSAGAVWQNNLNMSAGYTWLTVSHVSSSGTTTLYFAESGDELTSNDFPISGVSSGDSFFFTITYITST